MSRLNKEAKVAILNNYVKKYVEKQDKHLTVLADEVYKIVQDLYIKYYQSVFDKVRDLDYLMDNLCKSKTKSGSSVVFLRSLPKEEVSDSKNYDTIKLSLINETTLIGLFDGISSQVDIYNTSWKNETRLLGVNSLTPTDADYRLIPNLINYSFLTRSELKKYQKAVKNFNEATKEMNRNIVQVWSVLKTINSVKKLIEIVPEFEQFIPNDVVSSKQLVVLPTSAIKAIL